MGFGRKVSRVPQQLEPLQRAIAICGSRRELARRLRHYEPCTSGRIDMWFTRDTVVPLHMAPLISAAVEGQVSVEELEKATQRHLRKRERGRGLNTSD
ncbi:helix-turn-helix domain-containing protein [Paraburkholderia sp. Tr-20389]|nr:helix-turn-helix domain-containing protein [Paraburkholderia sp. Tr-20389]